MSIYNPNVSIRLDDLFSLKSAADCLPIVRNERDEIRAKYQKTENECAEAIYALKAELKKETEAADNLRKELDNLAKAKPIARPDELSLLFKQRVANAAEVLKHLKPVVLNDDHDTIEADRYNAVRKTLDELYSVVVAEVMK